MFFEVLLSTQLAIQNQIVTESNRQGLQPEIALAVAKVESGFNPKAVGKHGEIGLFQLHPKYVNAIFNRKENIRKGVQQLLYWKQHCPVQKGYAWVSCYNQGFRNPRFPELLPYMKKIAAAMREMQ